MSNKSSDDSRESNEVFLETEEVDGRPRLQEPDKMKRYVVVEFSDDLDDEGRPSINLVLKDWIDIVAGQYKTVFPYYIQSQSLMNELLKGERTINLSLCNSYDTVIKASSNVLDTAYSLMNDLLFNTDVSEVSQSEKETAGEENQPSSNRIRKSNKSKDFVYFKKHFNMVPVRNRPKSILKKNTAHSNQKSNSSTRKSNNPRQSNLPEIPRFPAPPAKTTPTLNQPHTARKTTVAPPAPSTSRQALSPIPGPSARVDITTNSESLAYSNSSSSNTNFGTTTPTSTARTHLRTVNEKSAASCHHCKELLVVVRQLQADVTDLREMMREHQKHCVLRHAVVPPEQAVKFPERPDYLPAESVESVLELEKRLINKELKAQLILYLSSRGTIHIELEAAVVQILQEIFTPAAAKQFSWAGSDIRRPFRKLDETLYCIQVSASRHPKFKSEDSGQLMVVESAIKKWFRGAMDRDGGRNERAANKRTHGGHQHGSSRQAAGVSSHSPSGSRPMWKRIIGRIDDESGSDN